MSLLDIYAAFSPALLVGGLILLVSYLSGDR